MVNGGEDLIESEILRGRICGKHFVSGRAADLQDEKNPDWLPSIPVQQTADDRTAADILLSLHSEEGRNTEEIHFVPTGTEQEAPVETRVESVLQSEEDEHFVREASNVRINVERVIGVLRQKFVILSEKLPLSVIVRNGSKAAKVDKILHVCCALFNLCPSVIPTE